MCNSADSDLFILKSPLSLLFNSIVKVYTLSSWTGHEIEAERQRIESAAATILGKILFEFGHLETDLGLFLVWSNDGADLESLTERISEDALYAKLCRLENTAISRYENSQRALSDFRFWLNAAHAARLLRNEFIHGRWGIAAMSSEVVNIIGIPTSAQQREVRYTIAQLEERLAEIRLLRPQLRQLRLKWPL